MRRLRTLLSLLTSLWIPAAHAEAPPLQLVESAPVETTLGHADIPDAADVWLEMIEGAKTSLEFAEFYASSKPGSKLEPIIEAILAAGKRGVKVRFLADEKFYKTYPETLDRLAKGKNVEVRRIDFGKLSKGVLHAKYFLVDGRELYIGSQNFDWRSLEHIQELGVRVRDPALAGSLRDVFETDWALSGGADPAARVKTSTATFPVQLAYGDGTVAVRPVYSPKGWLPDEAQWDLPQLVSLIDGAKKTVRIQLLNYKAGDYEGNYFDTLEDALRRAALRGVTVQLMVADWSMKSGTIEGLQSLEPLKNVEVRLVSIPEWSGGFIDFARVVHAKYLVVDGDKSWLGTSNWSGDYFTQSRNVGLIVEGAPFGASLERFFATGWQSAYARAVEPGKTDYRAPRTK